MKRQITAALLFTLMTMLLAGCGQSPKAQLEQSTQDLFLGLVDNDVDRVMGSIPEGALPERLTRDDLRERISDGRGFPSYIRSVPDFSRARSGLKNVRVLKFEPDNGRAEFEVILENADSNSDYLPIVQTNGQWHLKFE